MDEARRGFFAAVAAHGLWGLMPAYLKLLQTVPPLQVMAHRLTWCCALVLAWLGLRGDLEPMRRALRAHRTRSLLLGTAILISGNWLTYIWAVQHGRIVEASLGYFINPLLNVALGVLFLSERLSLLRWCAVGSAIAGVSYLTIAQGHLPWIALVLGVSFSLYGLLRKIAEVDALPGLAAETLLLTPLALAYLVASEIAGKGLLPVHGAEGADWPVIALLLAAGVVTAVPLTLFAYGARRLPYATMGFIQYIGPTIQLALAVWVYREPFARSQAVAFGCIWFALLLYASTSPRKFSSEPQER